MPDKDINYRLIRSQVYIEDANNILSRKTWLKKESPIETERMYLPGYLFQVTVNAGKSYVKSEYVMVEAIDGEFSFIDNIEYDSNSEHRSLPSFILTYEECARIAEDNYKQFLTARNLKTKVGATIVSMVLETKIYYPLWVGYYKSKNRTYFKMADGVSGKILGSRLKKAVSRLIIDS